MTDNPTVEPPAMREGDIEWVFVSNTVLGGVSPGALERMAFGKTVPYLPNQNIGEGTRWCSDAWRERRLGQRGFPLRAQAGMSRVLGPTKGICMGTLVVVPAQDRFEEAVAAVAGMLSPDLEAGVGLGLWTPAIVRFPGRSVWGIHLQSSGPKGPIFANSRESDPGLWRRVADEIGAELVVWAVRDDEDRYAIWYQHPAADPADVRVVNGDKFLGEVEPVPRLFVELARRYGNGLREKGVDGVAVSVPTGSWRPLEPGEDPGELIEVPDPPPEDPPAAAGRSKKGGKSSKAGATTRKKAKAAAGGQASASVPEQVEEPVWVDEEGRVWTDESRTVEIIDGKRWMYMFEQSDPYPEDDMRAWPDWMFEPGCYGPLAELTYDVNGPEGKLAWFYGLGQSTLLQAGFSEEWIDREIREPLRN
ncbi:MAG: hypothetical protein H8E59_00400 [Actinobacteria bacterium]|nr:hypothetical protein [Actinomycetota bacterium]